jgi:hypothetical protein
MQMGKKNCFKWNQKGKKATSSMPMQYFQWPYHYIFPHTPTTQHHLQENMTWSLFKIRLYGNKPEENWIDSVKLKWLLQECTRAIQKVKNVRAYNPRSCFNVADESCGVSSRVWTVAWRSSCSKLFYVVSVIGWDNERADIKSRRLWGARRDSVFAGGER